MWSPHNQAMSKLEQIHLLDLAAANRTHSTRLRTYLLVDGEGFAIRMVLKRTHHDMGQHVLLPNDPRCDWDFLKNNMEVPECNWFAQSYISTLITLEEWRVLIVGGQIVYTVHTVKDPVKKTWSWDITTTYYLQELRYFMTTLNNRLHLTHQNRDLHKLGHLLMTRVCNPDLGSRSEQDMAEKKFHDSTMKTYEEL